MFKKSDALRLHRRVTAYYVLICLTLLLCVTGGAVFVSQSVLHDHSESACLARLGRYGSILILELLQNADVDLQPYVERFQREGGFDYCAVVSKKGAYLAHSSKDAKGTSAGQPVGERTQWGEVQCVQFEDDSGRILREYQAPLQSNSNTFGSLRIGVQVAKVSHTLGTTLEYAPLVILTPLFILAGGGFVLSRMLRPLAEVEHQLALTAMAPCVAESEFQATTPRGAGAAGWNRLVDYLHRLRESGPLEERLARAMAPGRQAVTEDVLQNLPDGVALTDENGNIEFANHAFAALVGGEKNAIDLLTSPLAEFFPDPDDARWLTGGQDLLSCFAGSSSLDADTGATLNRTVVGELENKNPLGVRVLRASRRRLMTEKTNPSRRLVWTIRDVTQQKLAEQMRSQFLDAATHELRTPLSNIKAYAETLALNEVADLDQQKEFYNIINAEATRLARFVDDLLDLSSIEMGSLAINRQPVELDRLIEEVIAKSRPLMEQKGLDFSTMLPPKFPEVSWDKDKIVAALVNLLGNAAKYTPSGERVFFKVRWESDVVMIEVEDTGLGIAADELPRVFDKFFRSGDERVRKQAGSGLGLSLAREVARLHGGELEAKSELDKGSTFTMTLPVG